MGSVRWKFMSLTLTWQCICIWSAKHLRWCYFFGGLNFYPDLLRSATMKWVLYIHGEAADIKEQMIANEKSYEDINCTGRGLWRVHITCYEWAFKVTGILTMSEGAQIVDWEKDLGIERWVVNLQRVISCVLCSGIRLPRHIIPLFAVISIRHLSPPRGSACWVSVYSGLLSSLWNDFQSGSRAIRPTTLTSVQDYLPRWGARRNIHTALGNLLRYYIPSGRNLTFLLLFLVLSRYHDARSSAIQGNWDVHGHSS
jgi:hypothetical protein